MQSKIIGIIIIVLVLIIGGYFLLRGNYQAPVSTTTPTNELNAPTKTPPTGEVKEFNMTAKNWEFNPSTITVNKGDTVKLHIESVDVTHGFGLTEFGINEWLKPGKPVNVEFVADKTGTFTFACTVFCGSGHDSMQGQLVVQ